MSGPSAVAVVSALAAVLGLVSILSYILNRARQTRTVRTTAGSIEVVARAGLAPRQGVATLRVGGRLMLVSYGDGGVRHLTDVEPAQAVESPENLPAPRPTPIRGFGRREHDPRRSRASTWMLLAGVLGMWGSPSGLAAQVAGGSGVPSAAAASSGVMIGAGMPITLTVGSSEEDGLTVSGPVGTVLFLGAMTLIPTLLLLTTSFTRILIVLHLLKQALGTQTAPPAHLLAAMALLLTGFVMAPTFEVVHATAIEPWMNGEMDEMQMFQAASIPMRDFMLSVTREQDLEAFLAMRDAPMPETIDEVPFIVVTSAFVTSELTSAFQMGFAIFLPFVVIDIVVASVLMSMGMFMLPPAMISLPFKLLLFVLIDGWSLIMSSLVQSF